MRPVFYPYKMKSSSAKTLAQEFNAERVYPDGNFRNNFKRPIINWGNSTRPNWMKRWPDQIILNAPEAVEIAANKDLTFLKFMLHDVKHPEWTTDRDILLSWGEDTLVVARLVLNGKGGEGINIRSALALSGSSPYPLYTKYFKKKYEYRVHICNGKVIDFALKKKREGEEVNYQIRNASNGWVFCREGVVLPPCVAEEAIKAVKALGLTFGAVDVGYNEKKNEPCVFEVNSAPGLQGSTILAYKKAFKEYLNAID